jgi:hypothetical protein
VGGKNSREVRFSAYHSKPFFPVPVLESNGIFIHFFCNYEVKFSGRKIYAGKGERRRVLGVHTTTQNMGMDGLGKNPLSVSTFILFSGGDPLRRSWA